MSRSKRVRRAEPAPEQPASQPDSDAAWDAPEFRRSALITLAFVAAPAAVMLALGEPVYAAVWLGVGLLIMAYEARRQLRGFWRALWEAPRSGRQ